MSFSAFYFLNPAGHVELVFGDVVTVSLDDFLEAAHGIFTRDILARSSGESFGDVEWLREEALYLSGALHKKLVVVGELFDAENGDDILEVFVALYDALYLTCHVVVFFADKRRCERR